MKTLAVAVTWNQGNYIPWRGCHPLYQGLIDPAPEGLEINAWDHVALQEKLATSTPTQRWLLSEVTKLQAHPRKGTTSRLTVEDQLLTLCLPGDIELFHSIPFPSLTRPFWFHFESLRSLFLPWLAENAPIQEQLADIREYYRQLLSSPWCLGISSHLPETLEALSDFVADPEITRRLITTPIGLPASQGAGAPALSTKSDLASPRFLFAVSADSDADFFTSGGHLVLRTWQALNAAAQPGILTLACTRPSAEALKAAGVDSDFVERQAGHSILWTSASRSEVEALMASSHVFLQPADTLCTVEILRAMSLGCVPVIAAVQGTSRLLQDNVHGLIVGNEPVPTQPWERSIRSDQEEQQIILEMLTRIPQLLAPSIYDAFQSNACQRAVTELTSQSFAHTLWTNVVERYARSRHTKRFLPKSPLRHCLLTGEGLSGAFNATARPQLRINTGKCQVWSQGGYYVMVEGSPNNAPQQWSVLLQYTQPQALPMLFEHGLPALQGMYLAQPPTSRRTPLTYAPRVVQALSQLLLPYPRLHSVCSGWLRRCRHLRQRLSKVGRNRRQPSFPTATAARPRATQQEDTHDTL